MLQNTIFVLIYIFSEITYGDSKIFLLNKDFRNDNGLRKSSGRVVRNKLLRQRDGPCWMSFDAKQYIEDMEKLDELYSSTIEQYDKETSKQVKLFDQQTLQTMLSSRGRLESKGAPYEEIPAGLNLGGFFMMKQENSLMFFHRVKLRNQTIFRINQLETDLKKMGIKAQLSLQDLHLFGSYERALLLSEPTDMFYVPTYGLAEILLKDVEYSMEGRLRFLHDNPYIVIVNSDMRFKQGLLTHKTNSSSRKDEPLMMEHVETGMMDKIKADLDEWLRDFFNHYLMFFQPTASSTVTYREYQVKRTNLMNNYVDNAIHFLRNRLIEYNATAVKIPNFKIMGIKSLEIALNDGVLRGLNTIYRRSVATGSKDQTKSGPLHKVDAVIGFTNLKAVYKYAVHLTNKPVLNGVFSLSAGGVTAHMALSLLENPETAEMNISSIQYMGERTLVVEGPANREISNFKHILEYHILTLMSNTLLHNIRLLTTLVTCDPSYVGHRDPGSDEQYPESDEKDAKNIPEAVSKEKSTICPPIPTTKELPLGNVNYENVDVEKEDYEDSKKTTERSTRSPDYVVNRENSAEVQIPNGEQNKTKKYHLKLKETLSIAKLD